MSLLANAQTSEPESANAFGGATDFGASEASGRQSLAEFVANNHSLLSLWFAGPNEAPAVLLPCPCCSANVTRCVIRVYAPFRNSSTHAYQWLYGELPGFAALFLLTLLHKHTNTHAHTHAHTCRM